jgi:hypothetical protein
VAKSDAPEIAFCGFDPPNQKIFQNPHKAVILSEAPRRSIAKQRVSGAESKDPEDGYWPMLSTAFRPQNLKEIKKVTASERKE